MKVSDILRFKDGGTGGTLFTISPDQNLNQAMQLMHEHDMGSLVVMLHGKLVGMLTFREVIAAVVRNSAAVGELAIADAMDANPLICSPETDLDEVRRMMLTRHARYMPVMDQQVLLGVISFYDVAKTVVESQSFENQMLKAYIRDWPADTEKPEANSL